MKRMLPRWRPRYALHAFALWTVIIGVTGLITEVSLRAFHTALPQPVDNHLATGYHTGYTGIYRYNLATKRMIMKPNFERRMYFNTYWWGHKTDSLGFRNPTDRSRADVVLLGDSMVYGHGLEQRDTIRHQLEEIIGRPVCNLGQQGSSAHYEYHILKDVALGLQPQFIFSFFLVNDIQDLTLQLGDAEMERFIAQQTDIANITYTTQSAPGPGSLEAFKLAISQDLYTIRAMSALKEILRHKFARAFIGEAQAASADWKRQAFFQRDQRMALAMAFHLDALKKMHAIAASHGIAFVNVFIYFGERRFAAEESLFEHILQDFCHAHQIPFLSLRPIFSQYTGAESLFLERDGHFAPRGARLTAEALAAYMKKKPLSRH